MLLPLARRVGGLIHDHRYLVRVGRLAVDVGDDTLPDGRRAPAGGRRLEAHPLAGLDVLFLDGGDLRAAKVTPGDVFTSKSKIMVTVATTLPW